jgi:Ca-activated chloride channel family protein
LEKTDFSVFEDGLAQEISFFRADDAPATVGVIFDLSGSMSGVKIERAKDALTRFFQNSHPDDEYSIVGFSDRPRVLLKRAHDAEPVVDGVSRMSPRGATALYDAIDTGLEQVTRGAWNKRALIVISDGQDNHSRTSLKALKRTVAESGVIVYCVLIKDLLPFHQGDELRELSESSGGLSFSPSSADHMSEAFDRIAVDLRRRYSIGYTPSNFSADDRWRRLKVKVLSLPGAPRLIANTRKGYFATAGGSRRGLPETLGGGAR